MNKMEPKDISGLKVLSDEAVGKNRERHENIVRDTLYDSMEQAPPQDQQGLYREHRGGKK